MKCQWCHNPESQEWLPGETFTSEKRNCLRPFYRVIPYRTAWQVTVEDLMPEILKDRVFYEESDGGVTFSGGEPLMQKDFLKAILQACKLENLHTAVDTSGFASWDSFKFVMPLVDLFLYDIKFIDNQKHQEFTGVSNEIILENLEKLNKEHVTLFIRIPLIPRITDTEDNLQQLADYLQRFSSLRRVDLLPYNPMGEQKYQKLNKQQKLLNLKTQSREDLERMKMIFINRNFEVTLGG